MIIVLVAVILFGGVFAYQHFFVKPQVQIIQPVQKINQTAGWKIYTNTQYGFEFKYPSNYYMVSDSPVNSDFLKHNVRGIGFGWNGKLEMSPYFGVNIYDSTDNSVWLKDMEYTEKSDGSDSPGKYVDSVVISKNPDIYKFNFSFGDYGGGSSYYGIVGKEYSIYFGPDFGENTTTGDISRSIISTFKFTVPASQNTLSLWPDVNSFDLINKTFTAKGVRKTADVISNIKVYTNSSTKFSSIGVTPSMADFQSMYSMLKNWVGPQWWFDITGTYQKDDSFLASEISIKGQY